METQNTEVAAQYYRSDTLTILSTVCLFFVQPRRLFLECWYVDIVSPDSPKGNK